MKNVDPLREFEQLTACMKTDPPPRVHVVAQVMHRVRAAEAASERTLTLLAAGSCVAAIVAVVVGFSLLSNLTNPLESLLQIVPPIGL